MNQKSTFFIPILDLFFKFVYIGSKLDQIMVVMTENKKKLNAADLASLLRSEINLVNTFAMTNFQQSEIWRTLMVFPEAQYEKH